MKLHDRILQSILNATWLRGRELFAAQLAASIVAQISAERKNRLDSRLRGNDVNGAVVNFPSPTRGRGCPEGAGEGKNIPSPLAGEGQGERGKHRHPSPMWFGHRVFRAIATVAIVAMVNLTVHPLAVAMTAPKLVNTSANWQTEFSPDRQLVELIDNVRATLMSPADSVMRKEFDPKAALEKFDTLTEKIRVSMEAERKAATDTAKLDNLKQQFESRSQTFRDKLQAMVPQGILFKTAKSDGTDLAQWLDEVSPLKKPEDLKEMPSQALRPNRANVPQELTNNPSPLAGEGQRERASTSPLPNAGEGSGERGLITKAQPLTTKAGSEVNDPQYLASTAETEITADIRAKAQELHNSPVEIYNWVRNNVEWQPTWGGQQTADMTLDVKRGNAMDIATLTIALLRAANIPARYAYGTVDVPANQFMNMVGDFANIDAAWDFASAGGIPLVGVTSGGQVSKMRMQHVWVEAAVPYYPSRGAKPASSKNPIDTWVPLDPSYKLYNYLSGLDAATITDIHGEQLVNNFTNSGAANNQEGWVQRLDSNIIASAQTQAQQNFETYVHNMQNPTVGDVIGGRTIKAQTLPYLPGTLTYVAAAKIATYAQLPANLQVRITLGLGWDKYDQSYLQSKIYPLYQMNQRSITISFKPASTADQNTLASLIPPNINDPSQFTSFFPSSIYVVPEIKRDDEVLLTAGTIALGEEITVGYNFQTPTQNYMNIQDSVIAGSYLALGVVGSNPSRKTFSALRDKLEQTKQILGSGTVAEKAVLTRERLQGDMYVTGIQEYYAQVISLSRMMSLQTTGIHQPVPMVGTFGYEPYQRTLFGINRGIETYCMFMNVRTVQVVNDRNGDKSKAKQLMLQVGMLSSLLESQVPELMFTDLNIAIKPEGLSAAKALGMALAQGQKIYTISQQNQTMALSALHLDSLAMSEIRNALASGKEVMAHTDQLTVPSFKGSGYVITDPITGEGVYKISGGKNGGTLSLDVFGGVLNEITLLKDLQSLQGQDTVAVATHMTILANLINMLFSSVMTSLRPDQNACLTHDQAASLVTGIQAMSMLSSAPIQVGAPIVMLGQMLGYLLILEMAFHFIQINMAIDDCGL